MRLNIGLFLAKRALLAPDKIALIYREQRITYRDLNARANRLANAIAARGIRPGERVALLLRNCPEYVELYFGLARLGIIMVGINWRLAPPEVAYILKDSGARLLFYDSEFSDVVEAACVDAPVEQLIQVEPGTTPLDLTYEQFIAGAPEEEPVVERGDGDPLLLMYTSGTTGYPKGAILTHEQMFWASCTVLVSMDYRQDDVNLSVMPMYHIGGMAMTTIYIHRGATIVLMRAWDAATTLRLIESERINHFMAVPAMLTSLLQEPAFTSTDLGSLRWLLATAAPVPAGLIRSYAAHGILVQQSYGLTETAGPATFTDAQRALDKAGSAGLPYFHTELRVVDMEGREVAPGEIGEVWIRAPHLIAGYWQNPAATAAAFRDGWFRTGDLAHRDSEGYLYIVDRKKDMIISGGENVYSVEVENVLYLHPGIDEVAIVAAPDERWGEVVCAVVVPKEGETLTLEELHEFCANKIARYKFPRRLVLSSQPLPRNPTGKLLKHRIRAELEQAK